MTDLDGSAENTGTADSPRGPVSDHAPAGPATTTDEIDAVIGDESTTSAFDALVQALAAGTANTYRGTPAEVRAQGNQEQDALNGYRGRQLLELFQNADDEQAGMEGPNRLLIRLDGSWLLIANTGAPFSTGGLESLVVANASPKQLQAGRYIGEKGLGLRSLLAWTDRLTVQSGALLVAFDRTHARGEVAALATTEPGIAREIDGWGDESFVAMLRFPFRPSVQAEGTQRAQALIDEGFDTALALELHPDAALQVAEQVGTIGPEALLFTRHLREVVVEVGEHRSWTVDRPPHGVEDAIVTVTDSTSGPSRWRVVREPGDVLVNGERRRFEVAVATQAHAEDSSPQPPRDAFPLCVYFPTGVLINVPAILHATLDVDGTRHRLTRTDANRTILRALANLLARVAEREAETDPLAGLRLVADVDHSGDDVRKLGFVGALHDALGDRCVIPDLSGTLRRPGDVSVPPATAWYAVADVVPSAFAVLAHPEAHASFGETLNQLGVQSLGFADASDRLFDAVDGISPEPSGRILGLLARHKLRLDVPLDWLLVAADGRPARPSRRPFFPAEGDAHGLPTWSPVAFLHPAALEALYASSGATTVADLRRKLTEVGYAVQPYSFSEIAPVLIREYRNQVAENGLDPVAGSGELLRALFALALPGSSIAPGLRVPVPTASGTIGVASDLYFGPAYNATPLTTALLQPLGPSRLVAPLERVGLSPDVSLDQAKEFLTWLGVADAPRLQPLDPTSSVASELAHEAVERASYPLAVPDKGGLIEDASQARTVLHGVEIRGARLPDQFERLITEAEPEAILAYLHTAAHRPLDEEPPRTASLWAKYFYQRSARAYRTIKVSDATRHVADQTAWVPASDGIRRRPSELVLGEAARALRGHLHEPALDIDHPLIQGVGREAVRGVLSRLGTPLSVAEIAPEQIYSVLSALPASNPDGSQARGLYTTLLGDRPPALGGSARDAFVSGGAVYCTQGDQASYVSVEHARYLPSGTPPPKTVLDRIPLFDVGAQHSVGAVEDLFGVRSLKKSEWAISDVSADALDPVRAQPLLERLRSTIPALYALRQGASKETDRAALRALRALTLVPCRAVHSTLTVLGQAPEQITLVDPYEGVVYDGKAFLVCPDDDLDSPLLIRALADLVATAVETPSKSGDFALLLASRTDAELNGALAKLGVRDPEGELMRARADLSGHPVNPPDTSPEADVAVASESTDNDETATRPLPPPTSPRNPSLPPAAAPTSVEPASVSNEPSRERPTRQHGQPAARRPLVVTGGASPVPPAPPQPTGSRTTQPETVSLEVAMRLEADQGRFPLRVDHVRGEQGPGCDILSFASVEARDEVVRAEGYRPDEVERFIEVKAGKTELTPNEARAATEFGAAYYIYHVASEKGSSIVTVVRNPLREDPPIARPTGWTVDLSSATDANYYVVDAV